MVYLLCNISGATLWVVGVLLVAVDEATTDQNVLRILLGLVDMDDLDYLTAQVLDFIRNGFTDMHMRRIVISVFVAVAITELQLDLFSTPIFLLVRNTEVVELLLDLLFAGEHGHVWFTGGQAATAAVHTKNLHDATCMGTRTQKLADDNSASQAVYVISNGHARVRERSLRVRDRRRGW